MWTRVNSTEFTFKNTYFGAFFLAHFLSKTQFFFQAHGAEINVEMSSNHVLGSNFENPLSSGE